MKKKLMIGLGLSLATVILASSALADTYDGPTIAWDDDGKTEMAFTVPAAYTVVIPTTIDLGSTTSYTPDTYVGTANNVFIKADSKLLATDVITVEIPTGQNFKATQGTSEIPLTVGITPNIGTGGLSGRFEGKTTTADVPVLSKTGLEIGAEAATGETATAGVINLSTTLQVKAGAADIASATLSGTHKGYVQFSVTKSVQP